MIETKKIETKMIENQCITVIPIYKERLEEDEIKCVSRYCKVLQGEPIVFVAPEGLNRSFYENAFPSIGFETFPDKYFTGTKAYNHLLLNVTFYERFANYDYMLIAQTDAVIWGKENRLQEFIRKGYDYIGAPWIPERRIWEWRFVNRGGRKRLECCKKAGQGITMGNGGFCLRNIKKSIALVKEFSWRKCYWFVKRNEDIFFGVFGEYNKCGFRLADEKTGLQFAGEYHLRERVEKGDIPWGVHGWKKEFASYSEMQKFLAAHGVDI